MGVQTDPATIAGYLQPECKPVNLPAHPLPFGVEIMKTEQTPTTAADVVQAMRDDIAYIDERINGAYEPWVSEWSLTLYQSNVETFVNGSK